MRARLVRVIRTFALAGLLTALALSALAGTAAAEKGKKKDDPTVELVKEFKGPVRPNSSMTIDAKCPRGSEVLSGSYTIGGSSFFAHASQARPVPDENVYRVTVTNPISGVLNGNQNANVTVGALCAESGHPVVVDGAYDRAGRHKAGRREDTVSTRTAVERGIDNNSVTTVNAKCPKGTSIFGGGFDTGGSEWTHTSAMAVASKKNWFNATLVYPPFDPILGVLRKHSSMQSEALCAKRGESLVLDSNLSSARRAEAAATAKKPKKKAKGTVVLVTNDLDGIGNGEVEGVDAKCPHGYTVFGGDVDIGGSALAIPTDAAIVSKVNAYRTTVANPPIDITTGIPKSTADVLVGALCAKNGTPIVVDGHFDSR